MDQITCFNELMCIKKNGEYELGNDIDCENNRISCILKYFTGKIIGHGFKVSNLILSDEIWGDEQTLALFSSMNRAEISDIIFENINMDYAKGCYTPRIGALAGVCSDCRISNVVVSVTNNSNGETPMLYEANNCDLQNNKMVCNGKIVPVAKYI